MLALVTSLTPHDAQALSLGRVVVVSALGEPLRAQIDVTGLSAEEAATLAAQIVSPDAFRAAGAEFNPALTGARTEIVRRGDGRALIQITGDRKVVEPFIDVVLDVNWSSGKLQRAYTLLIDPAKSATPPAPAAVAVAPALSTAPTPAPAPVASRPRGEARPSAPVAKAEPQPAAAAPRAAAPQAQGGDYRVRQGDTLSRIANRHRGAAVSLDQMLVALYRANPDAFVGDNMNRLKAGVVLRVPDGPTASAISGGEARQVIQAHSADFRAYRQKLAGAASATPAVQTKEPTRQVSGKVQTAVEDKKTSAAPPPPDQLKLSQGAVKGAGEEARIAAENQRKASEARMAELARNREELTQLAQAASLPASQAAAAHAPAAQPSAASAALPGLTVPVAPPLTASGADAASQPSPAASLASAAAAAPSASLAASRPAAKASAPQAKPAPAAEPGWLETLSENPLVIPGMAAAVVGLAVMVLMRLRRRNDAGFGSETSFLESKLQPDSFFGASGGQRIDTHDSTSGAASSLSYSLSQLDAIGDVDPVAEADVYLAYGRDLQAEEILKEALRADPSRTAVRSKLLEVYAKRADAINFELQADQLRQQVPADSPEWLKAQALGRELDPTNTLYGHDAATAVDFDTSTEPPPDLRTPTSPLPLAPVAPEMPTLPDLEPVTAPQELAPLSLDDAAMALEPEQTQPLDMPLPQITDLGAPTAPGLDIDLNSPPSITGMELTAPASADDLLELDGAVDAPLPVPETSAAPDFELRLDDEPAASAAEAPPLAFDFGDLSLELDGANATAPGVLDDEALTRKLDLAEEFHQIGDVEGARDLIDEVLAQADGPLRERAQGLKDQLGRA